MRRVKGRHPTRTSGLASDLHPICARHERGLRAVPAMVRRRASRRGDTGLRRELAFRVVGSRDFVALVRELLTSGFDHDFAARQIVDDCYRLVGADLHDKQHVVELLARGL